MFLHKMLCKEKKEQFPVTSLVFAVSLLFHLLLL